jgi:hypothetical protein
MVKKISKSKDDGEESKKIDSKKVEPKSNIKEIFINEGESAKSRIWPASDKKKRRKKIIIISIIIAVFIVGLVGLYFWAKAHNPDWLNRFKAKTITIDQNKAKYPSLLTGVLGVNKGDANLRPYAVSIENSPDARPQSGLAKAGLVYEAMTEGGITRFLAFFDQPPSEVGPVRSARTFFVDWAHEMPAFFVHCGGNGDALDEIPTLSNFFNADEFAFGSYFWRSTDRVAPHNLYTSGEDLAKLVKDQGWQTNLDYPAWLFQDEAAADKRGIGQTITIDFSSPDFVVTYNYDKTKNVYNRVIAGVPQVDADGTPVTVKNVALAYYDGQLVPDPNDNTVSWQLDTGKGGKSKVFMDGKEVDGTWARTSDGRTRFFDATGNEIKFDRGNTWIEAIVGEATATVTPLASSATTTNN